MANAVKSFRDREKYTHGGFVYVFDKVSKKTEGKLFWRCEKKTDDPRCCGRIHTVNGQFHLLVTPHNHGPDAASVEVSRIRTRIKRRAAETLEIPSQIVMAEMQGTSAAVQGRMPTKNAVRLAIQRTRNSGQAAPPQPGSREAIQVPDMYQMYQVAPGQIERFMLFDSGEGDDDRILIFGRTSHVNWSHEMDRLYVDGTFSIAPSLFAQIYVVLAERGGYVHPVLYCLLPNKRGATYERMFRAIRDIWPQLNPSSVSMDFELAAINAATVIFPNSEIFGCLYHLTSNMKKKLCTEGLHQRYSTDPQFALAARMIVALAFIPVTDLDDAMDALSTWNEFPEELRPVIEWFEDTYMGRLLRSGRRRPATYPSAMWSVHERTLNDEARTNNHAEAAHRRLQAELGVEHPTLWKFIDGLRSVQKGRDLFMEQYLRGEAPPNKRRKYVEADKRIKRIVQSYAERTKLEYLKGVSHNFVMDG